MFLRRIILSNNLCRRYASTSLVTISNSDNEQICRIKLNNPRQRNVLSLAMINELTQALEQYEKTFKSHYTYCWRSNCV